VLLTVRGRNVSLVAAISAHGIIHIKVLDDGTRNNACEHDFLNYLNL